MSRVPQVSLCSKSELDRTLLLLHRSDSAPPSQHSFIGLLKACIHLKSSSHALQVHALLTLHHVPLVGFLADYLIIALATCGAVDHALRTAHTLPCRTVFSWTALISTLTNHGRAHEALTLYRSMLQDGVEPNAHTFVSLFKACGSIPDLQQGRQLHAEARGKGFALDIFMGSTLVSMYGKCGDIEAAEEVYCGLAMRSNVLCNAMLSAYIEQGKGSKALSLYTQMQEDEVYMDQLTFMLALQACAILAEDENNLTLTGSATEGTPISIALELHAEAEAKHLTADTAIVNTLINVYGKCGALEEAEYTFSGLAERTVVSWRAMLSAYIEQGQGREALRVFAQMREEGVVEGQLTFAFALQACGLLADKEAAKEIGRALHADAKKTGVTQDLFVGSALVSMYSKCGAIADAEQVFSSLFSRNTVCWNAMMSAYIEQGHGQRALHLYARMQEEGVKPSRRTFVLAIQACVDYMESGDMGAPRKLSKSDLLETGSGLHADIRRYGFALDSFVGSMLVTMYGKCGAIGEAEHAFGGLLQRTIVSWTAMLSAYVEEGQGSKALLLYEQMQEQHVTLNDVALISIIQACSLTGSLDLCKQNKGILRQASICSRS